MTEQAQDRIWSGIDITKTIAGALAAVCAAVVGSFLGVAGTLIGAAVASVIGTVGTEIYDRWIKQGGKRLAPVFVKAPAAVGTPPVAAATPEDSPSHTVAPKPEIHWKRIALLAGVAFVLAMGSLTMVELFAHKSIASLVGNNTKAGSTVGGLLDPGSGGTTSTPTPAPSSRTPSDTAPAVAPTTTEPTTVAPTTTPPTTEPTTEPTTVAPTTAAPPAGTGKNNGAQTQ